HLVQHGERARADPRAAGRELDLLQDVDAVLAHRHFLAAGHGAAAVDHRALLEWAVVEDVGNAVVVAVALLGLAQRPPARRGPLLRVLQAVPDGAAGRN